MLTQKRMEREERILLSLKKLDFLSRKQLQIMHDLKSDRNAQRILKNMDKWLNSFYDGQNIYYLNKVGRERVNSDKIRKKSQNVSHFLMRNDVYIHLGMPSSWKNEIRIKYGDDITVVADAHFIVNGKHHIVEVDNTQTMKKNRIKIDKYRRLIEHNAFNGMPKFIWVTTTSYRKRCLMDHMEGLDSVVYLPIDFK